MAVCPRATGAIIRAGGDRPTGPSADSVRGTLGQPRHDVKKPRQEAGAWSGPEAEFIEALLLVLFPPHTLTPPDGRIDSVSVFSARSVATSRPQCGRRRCTDTELRRLVHMLPLHCGSTSGVIATYLKAGHVTVRGLTHRVDYWLSGSGRYRLR